MHEPHTTRASRALLHLAILPLTVATALLGAGCNTAEAERERNLLEIYTNTAESYYQLGDHDRAVHLGFGEPPHVLHADPTLPVPADPARCVRGAVRPRRWRRRRP